MKNNNNNNNPNTIIMKSKIHDFGNLPTFQHKIILFNPNNTPKEQDLLYILKLLENINNYVDSCKSLDTDMGLISLKIYNKLIQNKIYKIHTQKHNFRSKEIADIFGFIVKHWLNQIAILMDVQSQHIQNYQNKLSPNAANQLKINIDNILGLVHRYNYYYLIYQSLPKDDDNNPNQSVDMSIFEYKQPTINLSKKYIKEQIEGVYTNFVPLQKERIQSDDIVKLLAQQLGNTFSGKPHKSQMEKVVNTKLGTDNNTLTSLSYLDAMYDYVVREYKQTGTQQTRFHQRIFGKKSSPKNVCKYNIYIPYIYISSFFETAITSHEVGQKLIL